MARKAKRGHAGPLRRAAASVKRIFSRSKKEKTSVAPVTATGRSDVETPIHASRERAQAREPQHARPIRRESDVPFDQLEQEYAPMQTGVKSGFRSDGSDMERDQAYANGAADERWNEEDRFTNHSGDPRIGTHGRSYEPGEAKSRRSKE